MARIHGQDVDINESVCYGRAVSVVVCYGGFLTEQVPFLRICVSAKTRFESE
jgi:hypothetical protein